MAGSAKKNGQNPCFAEMLERSSHAIPLGFELSHDLDDLGCELLV